MRSDSFALAPLLLPVADHKLLAGKICASNDLRKKTKRHYCYAWRYLCGAIYRHDPSLLKGPPIDRLTPATLAFLVAIWEETREPEHVANGLSSLISCAMSLFSKEEFASKDLSFIRSAIWHFAAKGKKTKTKRTVLSMVQATLPDAYSEVLEKLKFAKRADGRPLSDASIVSIVGDYLRFLGALQRANIEWKIAAPLDLITSDNTTIYEIDVHNEMKPWIDAKRLNAFAFVCRHLFPQVEIAFLFDRMAELRALDPTKSDAKPRKKSSFRLEDVDPLERERLSAALVESDDANVAEMEQAFADDGDDSDDELDPLDVLTINLIALKPKKKGRKLLRPDTEKGLWAVLRQFHATLEENAPHLRLQPIDYRDYEKAIEIFEASLDQCRPRGVATRLQQLHSVLKRIVVPGRSFRFLKRRIKELQKSDPKEPLLPVELKSSDLSATAIAVMSESLSRMLDLRDCNYSFVNLRDLAELFRNGLVLALLATVPLRLRTTSMLIDGETVKWTGIRYALDAPASMMKNKKPYYDELPIALNRWIKVYLDLVRGLICPGSKSKAFFLSRNGGALDRSAFQKFLPRLVLARCGVEFECHDVRRIFAQENFGMDPALIASGMQHGNVRSQQKYQPPTLRKSVPRVSSLKTLGGAAIQASIARKQIGT